MVSDVPGHRNRATAEPERVDQPLWRARREDFGSDGARHPEYVERERARLERLRTSTREGRRAEPRPVTRDTVHKGRGAGPFDKAVQPLALTTRPNIGAVNLPGWGRP